MSESHCIFPDLKNNTAFRRMEIGEVLDFQGTLHERMSHERMSHNKKQEQEII